MECSIFFADRSWVQGDKIRLEGSDVNHMKNVLRMKEGEEVQVSDGTGNAYLCQIEGYEGNQAVLKIREKTEKDTELPSKIWLFQGLPKGDKMELIVQKAVELECTALFHLRQSVQLSGWMRKRPGKSRFAGRRSQRELRSSQAEV